MRLLIVTGIFPPDVGGPATYVPRMAAALLARGHTATVVTLSDDAALADAPYPFRVIRIPRRQFKPLRWLKTIVTILRLARTAQVLFVNGLALETALANLLLRKPCVQKVVGDLAWRQAANRGWLPDDFESYQLRRYGVKVELVRALRAWTTRRMTGLIVPSEYLARIVAGWGVQPERITLIYNAVETRADLPPATLPLEVRFKVVTAGRLVSWKHLDQIMEAIKPLSHIGLALIGDGPERGRLEQLVQTLGLAGRVYFAGERSHAETLALMRAGDIFVLNSSYEGLPHVILEAMSLGLPVIATAAGGTPEVVQDGKNGILIPVGDTPALRQAVERLARSPAAGRRLSEAARSTARRFNPERMVAETEQVLMSAQARQVRVHA